MRKCRKCTNTCLKKNERFRGGFSLEPSGDFEARLKTQNFVCDFTLKDVKVEFAAEYKISLVGLAVGSFVNRTELLLVGACEFLSEFAGVNDKETSSNATMPPAPVFSKVIVSFSPFAASVPLI